jgi:hypothetical protein
MMFMVQTDFTLLTSQHRERLSWEEARVITSVEIHWLTLNASFALLINLARIKE